MTKTKQHKCNNAQEILLDGCHLLFEKYLLGQYQETGIFSSEHPVSLTEKKQSFKRLEIHFHISIKEANVLRRDYKEVRMLIRTF